MALDETTYDRDDAEFEDEDLDERPDDEDGPDRAGERDDSGDDDGDGDGDDDSSDDSSGSDGSDGDRESRRGRDGEASGERRRRGRRYTQLSADRSRCRFTREGVKRIDYKDIVTLQKLMTAQGKILSRKRTGIAARYQRMVKIAVKRARFMGLLPYTG